MVSTTYTYQGGKKLELSCATDHFISRSTKEKLLRDRFNPLHEVSPHSWSVATNVDRLQEDLVRARRLAPAYPAYCIAATGARFLVTDRVFVRFRHDAPNDAAHQLAEHFDMEVIERLSPRDFLLRVPRAYDVVDVVRNLTERELAEVELVDHDLNVRPHLQELLQSEPDVAHQWQFLAAVDDDPLIRSCALLDCEGAWNANGYGSPDVVIAIVDSGCDLSDPNFGPDKFIDWAVLMDGQLRSRDDFDSPARDDIMNPSQLHGTLCATLAAASINEYGGVGVAPNCSLLPVKWQNLSGTTTFPQSLFSKVVTFLRDKADVISNSWNRGANGYWPPYIVECVKDAALHGGRHGNGIVWVWSAGNHNCPIRYRGEIKVPITVSNDGSALTVIESSCEFVNSFADLPGVLHVGAISSLGQRCHYSNYGAGLDLVAPSGNSHLYGRERVAGIDVRAPLGRHGLHPFSGTSAAAPQVAGVAALVRSANPQLTSSEIVSLLRRTADQELDMTGYQPSSRPTDPDPAWDVSPIPPFQSGQFVGNGHPDGAWSPWFGFGKVNARRAVEEALRRLSMP